MDMDVETAAFIQFSQITDMNAIWETANKCYRKSIPDTQQHISRGWKHTEKCIFIPRISENSVIVRIF